MKTEWCDEKNVTGDVRCLKYFSYICMMMATPLWGAMDKK